MLDRSRRPAVLIICDGYGYNPQSYGNAITNARTPKIDNLLQKWPNTLVEASGEAVGLPAGQIGNSEVGHITIGSGRIKLQPLSRQISEIESGNFRNNPVLCRIIDRLKAKGSSLHIMGLLSSGGVHSYDGTAFELISMAKEAGIGNIYLHIFTDGRDVAPNSFKEYLTRVVTPKLKEIGAGKIASISGRYYAMDRDNRWDRTEQAYKMLTSDTFKQVSNLSDYVDHSYTTGVGDEFIEPARIKQEDGRQVSIEDGDGVVFFNFRPDRSRQISHALVDAEFDQFTRERRIVDLEFVSIANYDDDLEVEVAFRDEFLPDTIGEVVSLKGFKQCRIAETEKYAHVTYFFNGGREEPFEGEARIMVPSPKIATYDLEPEMSVKEVSRQSVEAIQSGNFDFVVINFANADMVGHTGVYDATVSAIEAMDSCIDEVVNSSIENGGFAIITADHGNAEVMKDEQDKPVTAHTTSPVPVILCGVEGAELRGSGGLRDITPTILDLMGLDAPDSMTGSSLLVS